tara:strand:- start:183 stop:1385 length:1203 start_codon:yes stop_codon:yes gene_type:complete
LNYKLSKRVDKIQPSFTLQMATVAAKMKNEGIEVVNFSVGEPDFNTPDHIIKAGKNAMDQGYTKYTSGPGMIEFRNAISNKLLTENGVKVSLDEILVSNGEKQSLYTACQALFNAGDEVLVFQPYWVSFPEFVRLADADPVFINTVPDNNFEPDFDDLQSKITKRVKGVILNSPSNPTGGVWSEESIVKLLIIAKKQGWTVISDECYERIIYQDKYKSTEKINQEHSIDAIVVTCMSLSKTYAMTGWRIGYSFGPKKIINAMSKLQGQATSCANSIGQMAGIAALSSSQDCVKKMVQLFKERRDLMVSLLNQLPNVSCKTPGGAFYAFPDFSAYLNKTVDGKVLEDTFDLSEYILESVNVATVPGDGFGSEGHIRFSYATSRDIIKKGLKKVKSALSKII